MKALRRTYGAYIALALVALLWGAPAIAKPAQKGGPDVTVAKPEAPAGASSTKTQKRSKSANKGPSVRPATASVDWVSAEVVDEYFRQ